MPPVQKVIIKILSFIVVLILCFSVQLSRAQGLMFSSNNTLISKRTSYQVFTKNDFSFNTRLNIEFDLKLWDENHLGYIVLVTDKDNSYSLSYLNTRNKSSLNFNIDRVSNKLSIPLSDDEIKKRKWIKVKICFDLARQTVDLVLNTKHYKATGFNFSKELSGNIVFGKNQYYTEVPDMAVKNVHIYDNTSSHYFPLNEWRGNNVHAKNGDVVGKVENPVWLINSSYFWTPVYQKGFAEVAGVNFDQYAQQLLMYKKDSLLTYNTQSGALAAYPYQNQLPVPLLLGKSIYNQREKKCYVYEAFEMPAQKTAIAALDLLTHKWESVGRAQMPTQRHHHNIFYNALQDTMFLFGGYGGFKYYNSFFKYDRSADKWVAVEFKGGKINPRFFSASGPAESADEIFIFGGYGNESGDQVIGGKEFYDLYRVNLKTHTVKKCWNIRAGNTPFVPANNLILSPDKKFIYALCYPHERSKTHLRLYKFSVKDGSYDIVSAAIPVTSEKIETDINLFYDAKAGMFFSVVQEFTDPLHSHIKVYSLLNPPVSQTLYLQSVKPKKNNTKTAVIFALIMVSILAASAFIWVKRRRRVAQTATAHTALDPNYPELNNVPPAVTEVKNNSVYLLGDFQVFSKAGRDITYLFSPKIKQLFLLILLNSKNGKGITSKKISLTLWPEKEVTKTKNLRGVTFNHLRNILSDLEGIQLQFLNDAYVFITTNEFFCDYFVIQDHIKQLVTDTQHYETYYHLLTRGVLLRDMGDAWLDVYKQKYDDEVMEVLLPQFTTLYQNKQYKKVLELTKHILLIAPFNEDAFKYEVKTLKKLKGKEYAKKMYDQFVDEYHHSFGEPYPIKFEDISQ
jgi:DNA-binding SARP family transcriptional activator